MNAQNPLVSFSFPFDRWRKQIQVYVFASFLGKRKKPDIDLHLGILQQVEIDIALWKWQIFHGENCHRSEQHDLKENSIVTCHRSPPHRCQCLTFVALRNENTSVKAFSSSCSSYKQWIYEKKPAGGQWRKSFTSAPQRPGREFTGVLDPLLLSSPLHHTPIQVTRCSQIRGRYRGKDFVRFCLVLKEGWNCDSRWQGRCFW